MGQSSCDQCGNRITACSVLMKMHMQKITSGLQILGILPMLVIVSVCAPSGGTISLEAHWSDWRPMRMNKRFGQAWIRKQEGKTKKTAHKSNIMERRWGQQVFTKYNPEDYPPRRKKWNRGFDQIETNKPEKPLFSNLHKQPVKPTLQERPRPSRPSTGGNHRPAMWIPVYLPRFSTFRRRLKNNSVLLELGVGAKIKV